MLSKKHKMFNELFRDDYFLWLRENSSVKKGNKGWFELTTPYLITHNQYRKNEYITVYVKQEKGVITISDDGEVLPWTVPAQADKIINAYGLKVLKGELRYKNDTELEVLTGELRVKCNEGDFVQKLHNLISAIIEINALKYAR
jgi:hypothetical protein